MKNSQLIEKLVDLKEEEVLTLVKEELESGNDPMAILETCRESMVLVGKRYEQDEYFLPELVMAGEIFKRAAEILQPALGNSNTGTKGTVVFGTVEGDVPATLLSLGTPEQVETYCRKLIDYVGKGGGFILFPLQ